VKIYIANGHEQDKVVPYVAATTLETARDLSYMRYPAGITECELMFTADDIPALEQALAQLRNTEQTETEEQK